MIDLYNATTNTLLGSITEADLKVLIDALEESDDVGSVHANFDVEASVLERIAS